MKDLKKKDAGYDPRADKRDPNPGNTSRAGKRQSKQYGKRNNNKRKGKYERTPASTAEALSSLNDISWYSKNPELLAAASRVPFPYVPGMEVKIPSVYADDSHSFDEIVGIPGVFVINFLATPGFSADVSSPISIAAAELYGRVRSKFSGSLDADAPDMMVYNLALDSIHMYIAHLKRIYRTLSLFATQNRDYPDRILKGLLGNEPASGFDILRSKRVQIWGMINELIHQVNKFVLPKDMDLYARHRWMCENIYLDNPSPKAQSYIFRPTHVWKFQMNTSEANPGSSLTPVKIPETQSFVGDPTQWYQLGIQLISALSNWDDGYTISGYYTRAFEGNDLYTAELLPYDGDFKPVYVPEVLDQIENAHTVTFVSTSQSSAAIPDIVQNPNTNALIWTPHAAKQPGESNYAVTLNLHSALPTGEEVTIASRLCSFERDEYVACGTEAVTGFRMIIADRTASGSAIEYDPSFQSYPTQLRTMPAALANWDSALQFVSRLSHFSRHPVVVAYPKATSSDPTAASTHYLPLGDMDNYTTVEKSTMAELHRVCTYSEFNCFR